MTETEQRLLAENLELKQALERIVIRASINKEAYEQYREEWKLVTSGCQQTAYFNTLIMRAYNIQDKISVITGGMHELQKAIGEFENTIQGV